jgi:predicted ATPase
MIKHINIEGFKTFSNLSLEVSNLNLLTGLNGMGKSTLIQAMLLLRQSYEKSGRKPTLFLNDDTLASLGVVKDVLAWDGDGKEMCFSISNEKHTLAIKAKKAGDTTDDTMEIEGDFDLAEKFSLFTDNFQYLNANRITPDDSFKLSNANVKKGNLGRVGEYTAHFLLENGRKDIPIKALCHASEKQKNYTLQHQIEKWLTEITPNPLSIKPIQVGNSIDIHYYSPENPLTERTRVNEGFGITYILGVLTALLSAKEGDLLLIENPEAHLHAKGQSKLAELMCLAAQNGVQIFCETHSDHVINATLVNVYEHFKYKGEKGIDFSKVSLLFFTKENNVSKVTQIAVSEKGRIKETPKGFFDQINIDLRRMI